MRPTHAAHTTLLPPSGFCQCGCGERTNIIPETCRRRGYIKGQPFKFIAGHSSRLQGFLEPIACGYCGLMFLPARRSQEFCTNKCVGRHKKRHGRSYPTTGNRRDHIIVAEWALGKPLPKDAEVHHFNGRIRDSRNKNLVICQDDAYHKLLHVRQRVRAAGGDPNRDKVCFKCRKPKPLSDFSPDSAARLSSRCKSCAADEQRTRRLTA